MAFIEENKRFVVDFKLSRAQSNQGAAIRNASVKEFVFEIDPSAEEESYKNFIDFIIEEICTHSFDVL